MDTPDVSVARVEKKLTRMDALSSPSGCPGKQKNWLPSFFHRGEHLTDQWKPMNIAGRLIFRPRQK
jgi:hypothetical protein